MISKLTLSLLLAAVVVALPASPARAADPPVRVKLSDDLFARGEAVRVRVKTSQSGYLVVLRADADGRIRVLFPLEPTETAAVRGGRNVEIRGRGDRDAFVADEREGSGKVLAATSAVPFRFDAFTRAGHWNYGALSAADTGSGAANGDEEAALLDVVARMAPAHYEYDLVTYTVAPVARIGRYAGWYDPWYVGRFGWGPLFYGPGFGFRTNILFGGTYFVRHRRW